MKAVLFTAAVILSFMGDMAHADAIKPATPQQVAAVRAAMQDKLKDADSAKFMDVQLTHGSNAPDGMLIVCGKVNAKNSYGAYGGYKAFFGNYLAATKDRKAFAIIMAIEEDDSPIANTMCEKSGISLN